MTANALSQWLLFLLLNLCAASIAFALAWRDKVTRNCLVNFLAAWCTYFLATIILIETLLGILGILTPLALALAFSVGAAVALFAFVRAGFRLGVPPGWHDSWTRALGSLSDGRVALTLAFAFWLTATLTLTALLEPTALYDSYVYHLNMPVDWLQRAAITPAYIPFAEVANSYFPGNAELLYFWTLAPFRNDLFVRLVPVGMWLLMALSLWRLARQCGASRTSSTFAVLIFVFSPLGLSQSTELWTDGMAATSFVLALGHLFAFARRPVLSNAALFGLAAGLHVGLKYSGPATLALLLISFALVLLTLLRGRRSRAIWGSIAVAGAGMAVTGGYWYLRNLLLAGNPVYPLGISFAGLEVLRGPGPSFGDTLWDYGATIDPRILLFGWLRGYGAFFYLAGLIAVFVAAHRFWAARCAPSPMKARSPRGLLALVSLALLGSLVLYFKTPYSIMRYSTLTAITPAVISAGMRFSMIAGACAVVLIAVAFRHLPRVFSPLWLLALLALGLGLVTGYDSREFRFFPSSIFTVQRLTATGVPIALAAFALAAVPGVRRSGPVRMRVRRAWPRWALVTLLTLLLGAAATDVVREYREGYRYDLYRSLFGELADSWQWMDENINDARVAWAGDVRMLAAYGADFSNEVHYINIAGDLDDRYDDFFGRGAGYREAPSPEDWVRNLADWRAEYLVVFRHREPLVEQSWVSEQPGIFHPVYSQGFVHIFRIDEERLAASAHSQ